MKNWLNLSRVIFLFMMVSVVALLHGCAVYTPYNFTPVTVPDIVKMSQEKVPAKNIIDEIRKSHTAYELKASEYAKLQQAGVADSVVNYMQETHIGMIRHNQQMQDSYYWGPYGGYWYGGWPYSYWGSPYGYWGWGSGPTFIFRGGGGYHGGGYHGGGFHGGDHRGR
jgi:hypothetical protein